MSNPVLGKIRKMFSGICGMLGPDQPVHPHSLIGPLPSTNRIIGCYRMYKWREKAWIILYVCAGLLNLPILNMLEGLFSTDIAHVKNQSLFYSILTFCLSSPEMLWNAKQTSDISWNISSLSYLDVMWGRAVPFYHLSACVITLFYRHYQDQGTLASPIFYINLKKTNKQILMHDTKQA